MKLDMRQVVRGAFIRVLAVAFMFSGAVWQACATPQAQAAPVVAAQDHQQAHHHGAAVAADHHDQGAPIKASMSDQAPQPDHSHNCLKCCSMCTVASVMPTYSATAAEFPGKIILFGVGRQDLYGFIAALDPGIPKPIV